MLGSTLVGINFKYLFILSSNIYIAICKKKEPVNCYYVLFNRQKVSVNETQNYSDKIVFRPMSCFRSRPVNKINE